MIYKKITPATPKNLKKPKKLRPLAKFNDVCERQEVRAILEFLRLKGFYCWKNETFPASILYTTKKGDVKQKTMMAGLKGSADIIGITPSGAFLAIEVKTSTKSRLIGLTEQQKAFRKEIEDRGGVYFLADAGIDKLFKKIESLFG